MTAIEDEYLINNVWYPCKIHIASQLILSQTNQIKLEVIFYVHKSFIQLGHYIDSQIPFIS